MSTVVLITASLNLKLDGGSTVRHYNGLWYETSNPREALDEMRGSRDEVLSWAQSLGADEIEIQEPTPEVLTANAQQHST